VGLRIQRIVAAFTRTQLIPSTGTVGEHDLDDRRNRLDARPVAL
jgi:hypothetical protein